MKACLSFLILLASLVISSCGIGHGNFNRQKYTSLRPISNDAHPETMTPVNPVIEVSLPEIVPVHIDSDSTAAKPDCDTLVLKTGERVPVEIKAGSSSKIYYTTCGNDLDSWQKINKRQVDTVITDKDPAAYGLTHLDGQLIKSAGFLLFMVGIFLFTLLLLIATEVLGSTKNILLTGAFSLVSLSFGLMLLMFNEKYHRGKIRPIIKLLSVLMLLLLFVTVAFVMVFGELIAPFIFTAVLFILLSLLLAFLIVKE